MERNPMTDSEAVRILGLSNSFTGEEELAAYRRIIKEYHPDLWDKASSEEKTKANDKMQKANAAHEYLKSKYFSTADDQKKRVTVGSYQSYSDFYSNGTSKTYAQAQQEKKDFYIIHLERIATNHIYKVDDDIRNVLNEILKIYQEYMFKIKYDPGDQIESLYRKAVYKIRAQYASLAEIFRKRIGFNEWPKKLDYYCTIDEFYYQLIKIEKEYKKQNNSIQKLKERLLKETEKYQNYIGYESLTDFITEAVQKAIAAIGSDFDKEYLISTVIKNMHTIIERKFEDYFAEMLTKEAEKYKNDVGYNQFVKNRIQGKIDIYSSFYIKEKNFDKSQEREIIASFHDEMENIFTRSFAIIERIKKFKNYFQDNPEYLENENFINLYEKLTSYERQFNNGADISNYLNKFEDDLKKALLYKENEIVIKKAYDALLKKYYDNLASLKLPYDHKKAVNLSKVFLSLMDIFAKLVNGEVEINKALEILSKITFNNYDEDMSLIEQVDNININSCIYIKNPDYMRDSVYDNSFFYLKAENGEHFMYNLGFSTRKEKISIDKIKKEFITLEEFLQKSEYVGKQFKKIGTDYLILYKLGQISIIISEGGFFDIVQNVPKMQSTPSNYQKYGGDYMDLNTLISAIKKQVEKKVIEYEKRSNKNYKIH